MKKAFGAIAALMGMATSSHAVAAQDYSGSAIRVTADPQAVNQICQKEDPSLGAAFEACRGRYNTSDSYGYSTSGTGSAAQAPVQVIQAVPADAPLTHRECIGMENDRQRADCLRAVDQQSRDQVRYAQLEQRERDQIARECSRHGYDISRTIYDARNIQQRTRTVTRNGDRVFSSRSTRDIGGLAEVLGMVNLGIGTARNLDRTVDCSSIYPWRPQYRR